MGMVPSVYVLNGLTRCGHLSEAEMEEVAVAVKMEAMMVEIAAAV
jgi:hypothetical protein